MDQMKKFNVIEKCFLCAFIGSLIMALISLIVAVYYYEKNMSSRFYPVCKIITTISFISFILIGIINANRPRKCPRCNTEMTRVEISGDICYECPKCNDIADTYISSSSG